MTTSILTFIKTYKNLCWLLLGIIIFVSGYSYWHYSVYHPSTDDAYVQANIINIAPQVGGPIAAVYVQDHQAVKRGTLLFTINPAPFQIAVSAAEAELALSKQDVGAASAGISTAAAAVTQRQAQLVDTQKNTARYLALVSRGLLPKAEGDNARANLAVATAALAAAQSQLEQAKQQLGVSGITNARIEAATAKLDQAHLDLQHTQVFAPADGTLVNFSLRVGSMVSADQPLFALVEAHNWWADANFKETDLVRIRLGQPATIAVDIYPDKVFHGTVTGISVGSGAAFSLLPPENATGNWVKVTQRFPVRVSIIDPDSKYPLRVGASSAVTIDTTK